MLCTLPETCDLGMLIQTSNRWKLSAWGQGAWPRGRGTPAGTEHPSSACIPHLLLSARSLRAKHHISGSVTRTGGSATSAILCNGIAASNQVRRNNIKCPTSWTILNRIILFFFFYLMKCYFLLFYWYLLHAICHCICQLPWQGTMWSLP